MGWFWLGVFLSVPLFADPFPLSVRATSETLSWTDHRAPPTVAFHVKGPDDKNAHCLVTTAGGRPVAVLRGSSSGEYTWDGRDATGEPVRAGTYFVEITEDNLLWNGAVAVLGSQP